MILSPNTPEASCAIQLNRPTKRNAMTSAMYVALAGIFNEAANDENTRVVLWHGAEIRSARATISRIFCKNPPGPGESPQADLMDGAGQLRQADWSRRSTAPRSVAAPPC